MIYKAIRFLICYPIISDAHETKDIPQWARCIDLHNYWRFYGYGRSR